MYCSMDKILKHAHENHYAVMAINCLNLETARGAILGAELENSPLIIQITPRSLNLHGGPDIFPKLVIELAHKVHVPVALNFDHGNQLDGIVSAMKQGFSSVMIDGSSLPFEENIKVTQVVTALAHQQGISVEAELGHVGEAADGDNHVASLLTNVEDAKHFVETTHVDALAVAVGTAHGFYPKGYTPKLDVERLKAIKEAVNMPLVLHGGSGLDDEGIRQAVAHGINKINIYSDLSEVCCHSLREYLDKTPNADMLDTFQAMEDAITRFTREYIKKIGSHNRYTF